MASRFQPQKYRLNNQMKAIESGKHPWCPSSHCSPAISLWRMWKTACREETMNPQSRGLKEGLQAYLLPSQCPVQHRKAYAWCRQLAAVMISWQLRMDRWQRPKHSVAHYEAAQLPCVRSTKIMFRWREIIVVAIEKLSAVLPTNDTND